jgi:hypothetical protein
MKVITLAECQDWLSTRNLECFRSAKGEPGEISIPSGLRSIQCFTPENSEKVVVLAHHLASLLTGHQALLCLTFWKPPDQHEKYDLVSLISKGLWQGRTLNEMPACVFEISVDADVLMLSALIMLIAAINWDGWIVDDAGQCIITLYDGIVTVSTEALSQALEMQEAIDYLGLENSPIGNWNEYFSRQ